MYTLCLLVYRPFGLLKADKNSYIPKICQVKNWFFTDFFKGIHIQNSHTPPPPKRSMDALCISQFQLLTSLQATPRDLHILFAHCPQGFTYKFMLRGPGFRQGQIFFRNEWKFIEYFYFQSMVSRSHLEQDENSRFCLCKLLFRNSLAKFNVTLQSKGIYYWEYML